MKRTLAMISGLALSALSVFAQDKIVIKGSDTLGAKMIPQLKEAYVAAGNTVDFEVAAEGSSAAFSNLLNGTADIGMSSRDITAEEKNQFTAKGLQYQEHVAGWDMIVVVVNKNNAVKGLTRQQIEGIFTGDITDWSEVGGAPGKISVYTRNTSSGTYKSFQELTMSKRDYGTSTQKMAGNEQIATEVANNPNGIGYVGLAYAEKEGLKAVKVDNVAPKARNKDKYPLARKLFLYTLADAKPATKKFVEWCLTAEKATQVVEAVGFLPNK